MAKSPDSRKGKDPARPTRSKAAREPLAPIAPALEKLLNPGIAKGTAGVGSGTGLKPPPDNSWDRRADFSAAHTARKSTQTQASPSPSPGGGGSATAGGRGGVNPSLRDSPPPGSLRDPTSPLQGEVTGFAESPQSPYTSDAELIEASPELARALGLDGDAVSFPEPQFERPKRERRPMQRGDIQSMGVAATAQSLDNLLREGRAEFKGAIAWTRSEEHTSELQS